MLARDLEHILRVNLRNGTSGPTQVGGINSLGESGRLLVSAGQKFSRVLLDQWKDDGDGHARRRLEPGVRDQRQRQITGTAYTKGNVADHAFIFQNGAMKDFGTLTGTISVGTAINTSGAVVDTRRCGARANSWCITRSFIAGRG